MFYNPNKAFKCKPSERSAFLIEEKESYHLSLILMMERESRSTITQRYLESGINVLLHSNNMIPSFCKEYKAFKRYKINVEYEIEISAKVENRLPSPYQTNCLITTK